MNFDVNAFLDSFRVMGLGMLGIFMVIIVLMVLLALFVFAGLFSYIAPSVIAMVLAWVIHPVAKRLENVFRKIKLPAKLASLIAVIVMYGIVSFILFWIGARVVELENSINDPEVLRDHILLRDTCDELEDTRFHQQELFDEWEKLLEEQEQYEQEEE